MGIELEIILAVILLILVVQNFVNSLHKRDHEDSRIQAFDMGRKSGIEHYQKSWEAAQKDFKRKHDDEDEPTL